MITYLTVVIKAMIDKEDKRPGTTHITKKYLKEKDDDHGQSNWQLCFVPHKNMSLNYLFFSPGRSSSRGHQVNCISRFFFKTFHSQLSFYRSVITECKSTERQKTTSHGLLLHYGNSFTSAVNDDLGHMPKIYLLF